MLFNSLHFLVFFPIVIAIYFVLPHRARWISVLIASLYFYMAFIPKFILALGALIFIDFFAAILIEKSRGKTRQAYFAVSILSNLGMLAAFKYFDFVNTNFTQLLQWCGLVNPIPNLQLVLPLGLSFHTFQSMSYTIEVYRKKQKAERNLGVYALYVLYWPQLVAGPIERPQNLLHQFYSQHPFDYDRVVAGFRQMLIGFFKKVVIADRLAFYVDQVFNHIADYRGISVVIAMYFFTIQIFCDFSGYSDIALGASKIMGINLMTNFDKPYLARSVSDFWRRWHISLSTWFRDYLYIPLGGNKSPGIWRYLNLMIVFVVSGFWHGANWTFIMWGFLHGVYLAFYHVSGKLRARMALALGLIKRPRLHAVTQVVVTFHLVAFAWIFFRANSITDAFVFIRHLFARSNPVSPAMGWGIDRDNLYVSFMLIAGLIAFQYFDTRSALVANADKYPRWLRWGVYYLMVVGLLVLGQYEAQRFIYFQF